MKDHIKQGVSLIQAHVQLQNFINYQRLASMLLKERYEKNTGSATITNRSFPRHQEEEETDKTKQAQIEQTYAKH